MREILFKGAGVNLSEVSVRKGFQVFVRVQIHQVCTRLLCGQMLVHGVVL